MIPHFKIPLEVGTDGTAVCWDQDTVDEVAQCVRVLVLTDAGTREAVPEYGVPQLPFRAGYLRSIILPQIDRWEPRAKIVADEAPDVLDDMIRVLALRLGLA